MQPDGVERKSASGRIDWMRKGKRKGEEESTPRYHLTFSPGENHFFDESYRGRTRGKKGLKLEVA